MRGQGLHDRAAEEAVRRRPQHQRDALQRDEHCERCDQRRQLDDADEKSIEKADERRDCKRKRYAEDEEPGPAFLSGEEGQDHDHQSGQRSDREIDAAGQKHDQLSGTDKGERAGEEENAVEAPGAEEFVVDGGGVDAEQDDQRRQNQHRRKVAREEPPQPGGPGLALFLALRLGTDRGAGDLLLGQIVSGQRADDLAARKDENAIAKPGELDRIGGQHHHAGAGFGDGAHNPIELDAGAGVDAARRLVGEKNHRLSRH